MGGHVPHAPSFSPVFVLTWGLLNKARPVAPQWTADQLQTLRVVLELSHVRTQTACLQSAIVINVHRHHGVMLKKAFIIDGNESVNKNHATSS